MQTKGVNCPHICMQCVNELYGENVFHSNGFWKEGRVGVFFFCCYEGYVALSESSERDVGPMTISKFYC